MNKKKIFILLDQIGMILAEANINDDIFNEICDIIWEIKKDII